jgi:hypothetical protein
LSDDPGPWWRRLGWLVLLWALSVAALALVAGLIRSALRV